MGKNVIPGKLKYEAGSIFDYKRLVLSNAPSYQFSINEEFPKLYAGVSEHFCQTTFLVPNAEKKPLASL